MPMRSLMREFVVVVDRMSRFGPPTVEAAFKTAAINPETVASNVVGNGRYDCALLHGVAKGFWIYLEEDHLLLSILEPGQLPVKPDTQVADVKVFPECPVKWDMSLPVVLTKVEIYVVTEGVHSDYRIRAIFRDKPVAKQFRALYCNEHESAVEVWVVDEWSDFTAQGLRAFSVGIKRDGDIAFCIPMGARKLRYEKSPDKFFQQVPYGEQVLRCIVYARDGKHAIKVASERRARFVAANQWPERDE